MFIVLALMIAQCVFCHGFSGLSAKTTECCSRTTSYRSGSSQSLGRTSVGWIYSTATKPWISFIRLFPTSDAPAHCQLISFVLCAQANLASYPQQDRQWVIAYRLRGERLVCWLEWWYVCVLHRGSSCSPLRAMDGHIMCHGIISSCNQLPLLRL